MERREEEAGGREVRAAGLGSRAVLPDVRRQRRATWSGWRRRERHAASLLRRRRRRADIGALARDTDEEHGVSGSPSSEVFAGDVVSVC